MSLGHLHHGQAGKRRRGLSTPAKIVLAMLVASIMTAFMFIATEWVLTRQSVTLPLRKPQFRSNDALLLKPLHKSVDRTGNIQQEINRRVLLGIIEGKVDMIDRHIP